MKRKLLLFVSLIMLSFPTLIAQTNKGNAKLTFIVGEFSGDYSNAQRNNVISSIANGYRAMAIDQNVYNNLPQSVRSKMHIDGIITGRCSLTTKREEYTYTDYSDNKRKKTRVSYNSEMITIITISDFSTNNVVLTPRFKSNASDENRDESIKKAINLGLTDGKKLALLLRQTLTFEEFIQDSYPLRGRIITLDEFKKNKAEVVTINIGGRDAIYRGQTFEVVGEKKNYGRLRVSEIKGDTLATCKIEESGKEIFAALEKGETVELISYVQALSLNGLIHASEQEAPRLNISDIREAKRRNLAYGGIYGSAPTEFVSSVKRQMDLNLRINAYGLNMPDCPDYSQLDGIVYGCYNGMKKTSRLVKAGDGELERLFHAKDYTEYKTIVDWYLYIIDPNTGEISYCGYQGASATSSKSADDATEKAILEAADITRATYSTYPIIGTILTIDETDRKEAKAVTINLGKSFPVYKGLRFDVYCQNASGDWEKVGRIKITAILDSTHSTCEVTNGGEKIRKAIEDNLSIRITTYILSDF